MDSTSTRYSRSIEFHKVDSGLNGVRVEDCSSEGLNSHREVLALREREGNDEHVQPSDPMDGIGWESFHPRAVDSVAQGVGQLDLGEACKALESAAFLVRRVAERIQAKDVHGPYDMDNILAAMNTNDAARSLLRRLAEIAEEKPAIFSRPQTIGTKAWFADYEPAMLAGYRRATPQEAERIASAVSAALRSDAENHTPSGCGAYGPYFAMFTDPDEPVRELTDLYRWFDFDDRLLYIGITNDTEVRFAAHGRSSSWMAFAERFTTETYRDRPAALRVERTAILTERPLFNRQHNDTPEARRRLVAYLVEKGRLDLLAPAVSRG